MNLEERLVSIKQSVTKKILPFSLATILALNLGGACKKKQIQTERFKTTPIKIWSQPIDIKEINGKFEEMDMALDKKSNIYITGLFYNGSDNDVITIKYDTDGNKIWKRIYDGEYNEGGLNIKIDNTENVYVTYYSTMEGYDYWIIGYDNEGNIISNKESEFIDLNMIKDDVGNIYWAEDDYSSREDMDIRTTKYDSKMNVIWKKTYNSGGEDNPQGITMDDLGNVYIVGSINYSKIVTIKYDNNGNEIWNKIYDSGSRDPGEDIAVDSLGNVYVIGGSWFIKYHKNGDTIWNRFCIDNEHSFCREIALDKNNNIYIVASPYDPENENIILIKYKQ